MENEVTEVVVSEGVGMCNTMSKTCLIGKALLITTVLGGLVFMGVRFAKNRKAKKMAMIEAQTSEETQNLS